MPFTKRALGFFRGLARNNAKPWFEAHRDEYETEVRGPMRELIADLDVRFAGFAPEIGADPKRSMFRINRDIRFSKDKSPYKTHAACWFHHLNASRNVGAGEFAGSAGYYFHLEPGGRSMIGGGIWMPPRPQLNTLHKAIADDPIGFDRMARSIPRRFGGLDDETKLKRMPRGYPEDHPAARWLRFQSFTSGHTLTDAQVTSASLVSLIAREYEALLPLVRWLNAPLGFKPASRR
jgi:uncharacterized protein (TIGR02453 family)